MSPLEDVLPADLAALVDSEIASGERVVWVGQPFPGRFARRSLPIVLFGIPWTAFALFWMAMAGGIAWKGHGAAPKNQPPMNGQAVLEPWALFFPLFGIPFVLIGLGMLSSPYWMRRKARRTAYVITDQRAIVAEGGVWRSTTIQSFAPGSLTDLRRTQYPDGSGNLIFQRRYQASQEGNAQFTEVGFMAIPDVKQVEELIRDLVRKADVPKG